MSFPPLIFSLFKIGLFARVLKTLLAGALGLAFLAWIIENRDMRATDVVIHVTESHVDVLIDDEVHRIDELRYEPLQCELTPGWHRLVMRRGDQILFGEVFEVVAGQNIVRTAYAPARRDPIVPRKPSRREDRRTAPRR